MKRTSIGGQALLEGVMMKNGNRYATAIRKPDGTLDIQVKEYIGLGEKYKVFRIPVIRGVVNFIESMVIGVQTITYSANFIEEEEPSPNQKKKAEKKARKKGKQTTEEKKEGLTPVEIGITVLSSLLLALALFMVLPNLITQAFHKQIHSEVIFALIEGVVRVIVFLLYVFAISKMSEIKRVFAYHGAEHKTINCLESGDPLTPENVLKHSRFHKRCGTMVISIFFFMFIRVDHVLLRLLARLLLIPVIAGVSYEFLKLSGRSHSRVLDILTKPGLWLQRMTTNEPDESMAQVAIESVEAVFDWREYQEAMKNGEIEDQ